jgi:hypothetical protein
MQREAFDLPIEGGKGFPDGGNSEIRQTSGEIGQTHTGFVGWHDLGPPGGGPPNGRIVTRATGLANYNILEIHINRWKILKSGWLPNTKVVSGSMGSLILKAFRNFVP